ncbi:MAG TPA: hypothetical protein VGG89_07515 [Candidatus Baltobacteraceae bacterium]
MEIERIPSRGLKRDDVPSTPEHWDEPFVRFALSFDGYKVLGDELASACNLVKELFAKHRKTLDVSSTDGLRMLLFYEQRRARWLDVPEVDDYSKAIADRLRKRLPK